MKTNWKEIDRMSRMSPEGFNKLQRQDYDALAARTQKASDDYSKQFLRDVNPKPKENKEGQSYEEFMNTVRLRAAGDQAYLEQFLNKAAQQGLSRETAQRLFIPRRTGRRPGDTF